MSRIEGLSAENVSSDSQQILDNVHNQLGFVPNLHRVIANSPRALAAWDASARALSDTLDVETRHGIALAVSQVNHCGYCLASHTYTALHMARISKEEVSANKQGKSSDPKRAVAIHFAKEVVEMRGNIRDRDVQGVKDAGFSDGEIIDIVSLAMQFSLTNMLNNVAGTHIDFPTGATAERSEDLEDNHTAADNSYLA